LPRVRGQITIDCHLREYHNLYHYPGVQTESAFSLACRVTGRRAPAAIVSARASETAAGHSDAGAILEARRDSNGSGCEAAGPLRQLWPYERFGERRCARAPPGVRPAKHVSP